METWRSHKEPFWPGRSGILKVTCERLPVWWQPEDTSALDFTLRVSDIGKSKAK
jgi:hypothetical protein